MSRQIIDDLTFENGFMLKHTDGLITRDNVRVFTLCNTAKKPPVWQLAQWCCNFNLAQGSEFVNYDNSVTISDQSKIVRTYKTGRLYLELKASVEYQHTRRDGEGWPHILIEQEFANPPYLATTKSITLGMDFTISNFRNAILNGEQKDIHCGQFQYIFAVSNMNKKSKGYGDFYWFNFSLYDSRSKFPSAFMQQDGGKEENTGKFIYVPEMKNILKKPVVLCEKYFLNYDIRDELIKAFNIAKERGFLPDSNFEDMAVKNTNIGWELTGTFDAGVDIERLSLECED